MRSRGIPVGDEREKGRGAIVVPFAVESGRATTWRIRCSAKKHGVAPVEFASKAAAVEAARNHIVNAHRRRGVVFAPKSGSASGKRRRRAS